MIEISLQSTGHIALIDWREISVKQSVGILLDHMVENELLKSFQSAYRAGHSTETALLRVHHDIVNAG